jgi:imidazolonepropionase-like amidohydrolase
MISTAHSLNVRVAAHCVNPSTIKTLLSAGIDTLEHGTEMTEQLLGEMKERGVVWCPTLAAYYSHQYPGSREWDSVKTVLRMAVEMGIRVATGGDTGVFPHGENALEMQLMHRLGIQWEEIIRAATWTAWLCVRGMYWDSEEGKKELEGYTCEGSGQWEDKVMLDNEVPVGCIAPGFAADIIATDGDLERDFEKAVEARSICFVMKGGVVYKRGGASFC